MNKIGLHPEKSDLLCLELNKLLSNYMVFYQNTRGFHWNIRGEKFFELHLKFEELYTDLLIKIDEIAERILTLGGAPLHTFEDYTAESVVRSVKNIQQGSLCVSHILSAFEVLLIQQRKILLQSAGIEDEGTNALMSDYIRAQEKLVWMYTAYLNQPE